MIWNWDIAPRQNRSIKRRASRLCETAIFILSHKAGFCNLFFVLRPFLRHSYAILCLFWLLQSGKLKSVLPDSLSPLLAAQPACRLRGRLPSTWGTLCGPVHRKGLGENRCFPPAPLSPFQGHFLSFQSVYAPVVQSGYLLWNPAGAPEAKSEAYTVTCPPVFWQ